MSNTLRQLVYEGSPAMPVDFTGTLKKSLAYSTESINVQTTLITALYSNILEQKADFFLTSKLDQVHSLPEGIDFFALTPETAVIFSSGQTTLTQLRNFFCMPVAFIGAGPGEIGWMTIEGQQFLNECDICFYDALANPLFIASLPAKTERYYVGKRGDSNSFDQNQINQLIAFHCRMGKKVVRLKGGDSGIFGRINEEIDELAQYQLPYSITPGISAMQSLPSETGVFLTRRGMADRVTLCSGRKAGGAISDHHPYEKGTLVIYMGVLSAQEICDALLEENYSPDLPAAVAVNLTRPGQKLLHSTLKDLPATISEFNLRPPGLLIFGDAALKEMQCQPAFSPLLGRTALLAGSDEDSATTARLLRRFGMKTISFSLFRTCLQSGEFKAPAFDDVIVFSAESAKEFHDIVKNKEVQLNGAFVAANKAADATIQCLLRRPCQIALESPESILRVLQSYCMQLQL